MALRPTILALAIAVLGGLVFWILKLPLPWMLGPMIATTAASLGGLRVSLPGQWRDPTIAVLGVLLGSSFTAEMAGGMALWLPTLALVPVYVVVIGTISVIYLRRVAGLDPRTAFFCATPGGLGEMVILGDRVGADMRTIALVHGTRVLLVVLMVPFAFRFMGYELGNAQMTIGPEPGLCDLLLMVVAGIVGVVLGNRLRLPAPGMLGPMLVSAGMHLTGLVHGAPPFLIVAAAQLIIGGSVGCRFRGYALSRVIWMMLTGLGLTIIMMALAFLLSWVAQALTGLPLPQLVLAYAPGGVAELSLVALVVTGDAAFVATHHICRIGLVVLTASNVFRFYERLLKAG